jgi:hypothetical protein
LALIFAVASAQYGIYNRGLSYGSYGAVPVAAHYPTAHYGGVYAPGVAVAGVPAYGRIYG